MDGPSALSERSNDADSITHWLQRQPGSENVATFGPEAERWGRRIAGGASCVLADSFASAQALEEATRRRRSARTLTGPVLDESRAVVARKLAPLIMLRAGQRRERTAMFDALARNALVLDEISQCDVRAVDERVKTTLRDLYLVGVATLVRSRRQAAFLGGLFGRYRPGYVVRPGIDSDVPAPQARDGGNTIVIWAAHTDIAALSIHLFALADVKAPIVVIGCGDAKQFPNVRVAALAIAGHELRRAALVIDATLSDPASAVALAAWKVPLLVTSSSGADEFLDAVRLYDPWDWRSIAAAVAAARADAPTAATKLDWEAPLTAEPACAMAHCRQGPLVTIVIPTFNRARILPMALDSLQSQSYPNIEMLVVNDGGEPIEHVVARYSRARSISNRENRGTFNSCNIGIAHARGEYIGFLADDDIWYSDHVERNVAALEQTQGNVARANALTRFLEMDSEGVLQTSGNQVFFANYQDVNEALWWGSLAGALVRRDAFDQVGMFDSTNALADYEMLVRLSRCFDFIHIDQVTFEWRYRLDRSTFMHQVGTAATIDGLERIYAKYPSNGDYIVERGRAATLAFIRDHSVLPYFEPALRLEMKAKR